MELFAKMPSPSPMIKGLQRSLSILGLWFLLIGITDAKEYVCSSCEKCTNNMSTEYTMCENCTSCKHYDSCSGPIAAAVLVPLFLEALIAGGIVAIVLWKWRRRVAEVLPSVSWSQQIKPYIMERILHNPTYGAEDHPPTSPSPSDQKSSPPLDLYEEIDPEAPVNEAEITLEGDAMPSCYAYATHDIRLTTEKTALEADDDTLSSIYDLATHDYHLDTTESEVDTEKRPNRRHSDIKRPTAVRAYAVSNVKSDKRRSYSSAGEWIGRDTTHERGHGHGGVHHSSIQRKKKKPIPAPKNPELVAESKKLIQAAKLGANQHDVSNGSKLSQLQNYSKLNPKTQYVGLEPHMGGPNNHGQQKTKALPPMNMPEEYSHLKH